MLSKGKYRRIIAKYMHKHLPFLPALRYDYPETVRHFFAPEDQWENVFPVVIPQWDRTPRAGKGEGVYVNATPANFGKHLSAAIDIIKDKTDEHKIIFVKSWNEWGEGNYIEPDEKYRHGFLDAIKNVLGK
jgi:lipopolysaccharide biosynthesis protein